MAQILDSLGRIKHLADIFSMLELSAADLRKLHKASLTQQDFVPRIKLIYGFQCSRNQHKIYPRHTAHRVS